MRSTSNSIFSFVAVASASIHGKFNGLDGRYVANKSKSTKNPNILFTQKCVDRFVVETEKRMASFAYSCGPFYVIGTFRPVQQ